MSKILLTGANGFLGKALLKGLSNEFEIDSLGRSSANTIIGDLAAEIPDLPNYKYDLVVHAAGKAHMVPRSEADRNEFAKVNFEGTKHLCKALSLLPSLPKAFVFISTVAVYGLNSGSAISEIHPLNGETPYAKSKILAERWLAEWCDRMGIVLSVLRLPLIAGPHAPGNLGAMINGIKSGRYLSIGNAEAKKSIVWADDIATIIPRLVEVGGIYNLTDGIHPSFSELERAISTALNKKNPLKVPLWVARGLGMVGDLVGTQFPINTDKLYKITSTLTFDDSKARKQLRWEPTPVLSKLPEII